MYFKYVFQLLVFQLLHNTVELCHQSLATFGLKGLQYAFRMAYSSENSQLTHSSSCRMCCKLGYSIPYIQAPQLHTQEWYACYSNSARIITGRGCVAIFSTGQHNSPNVKRVNQLLLGNMGPDLQRFLRFFITYSQDVLKNMS